MFKRRDRRPFWEILARLVYPRGGWGRAIEYVRHRVTRLPGSPEKIGRGIWAGVFVSFTPFFGFHFLLAAFVAKIMRGNIIAGLLATFFGNPLTFFAIAASALKTGYWILGRDPDQMRIRNLGHAFGDAWLSIWRNFLALFTDRDADWAGLGHFFDGVFMPYLVGGILPGVIVATGIYILVVPVIRAYQKRRARTRQARLEKRRKARLGSGKSGPAR